MAAAAQVLAFAVIGAALSGAAATAQVIGPSPSVLDPMPSVTDPVRPVPGDFVQMRLPPRRPDAGTLAATFRPRVATAAPVYSEVKVVPARTVASDRLFWLTIGNGF